MTDLSGYPPLMRVREVAQVLNINWKTLHRIVARRDTRQAPMPCMRQPYRWRREQVALFIDTRALEEVEAPQLSLELTL